MLALPGGGPGGLWGALGPPLGPLGASLGSLGVVFWRLRGALGSRRAESLKKRPFGDRFWTILGAFFYVFSCSSGASPALLFCSVPGSFLSRSSSCSSSGGASARKWWTPVAYCKNQWNFINFRSWPRRPHCEKEVGDDAKTSVKYHFPGGPN